MKRSRIFWWLFAAFGTILMGTVAISGFMYFLQERNSQYTASFWALSDEAYNITKLRNSDLLLSVAVGFNDFEPGAGLDVAIDFVPANNLNVSGVPKVPVCVTYKDTDLNFTTKTVMPEQTLNIAMTGDVNWYPFDTYHGEFWMYAHTAADVNGSCSDPLPILPAVFGSVQGFSVSASVQPGAVDGVDYSYVAMKFFARRAAVSIGFAVLVFIVMWCLTISIVITTAWFWITGRRVELPFVTICTALLYALPNIRSSQPGIPLRAGIIADMVGYVWNVLLVSLSVVSLIVNYIYRKDGKKPKVKKVEEKEV